jgi:DNA polymerase III delta prime subunit
MQQQQIHEEINVKLQGFIKAAKIPNIIFHGPSGSGKRTLVNDFIQSVYNGEKSAIKNLVCYVNCAHGKGIKFIREELKFFAKTHIYSNDGNTFKTIVLSNADKLTMDAQSALRRCIELFSHNTRFFIIVEDKYKLLKPILSRFCEIYVSEPIIDGKPVNLYKYGVNKVFDIAEPKLDWVKKELNKLQKEEQVELNQLIELSTHIYERGGSAMDLIHILETCPKMLESKLSLEKRYEFLLSFHKIRREFRNEKLLILFILNFLFISSNMSLENISFM